jgi:predicted RecA/RadA family phage recombinase
MATAQFIHDGEQIDYTPGSAVAAGAVVVQGELIGIAKVDIPPTRSARWR